MKIDVKEDRVIARGGLGLARSVAFHEVESFEVVENHAKASISMRLFGGETRNFKKLGIDEARRAGEALRLSLDPPEAEAGGPLPLSEIAERLGAMSARPGLRPSRLWAFLLGQVVAHDGTDLHLEGSGDGIEALFRLDGVLHRAGFIKGVPAERLLTFLKVESGVAGYRSDVPQEGTIHQNGHGGGVDLRCSFIPASGHEKAAIRFFGKGGVDLELGALGFSDDVRAAIGKVLGGREGMFLLTGPSSSGKTTTLYSCLSRLAGGKGEVRQSQIVSIEDPVERRIPGVSQVRVDPRRDMTFARLLSSLLRQDAEVVMVGEVRDAETAGVAVQAALTGHLILSTIHAGRAPEVPVRLLDLGVEPYKLAGSLRAAMSQRLVRTVCPACGEAREPSPELIGQYAALLPEAPRFMSGMGCEHCRGTGYRGRTAAAELINFDGDWEDLVRSKTTSAEAMRLAGEKGMATLFADAANKAARGITTLEEIKRVLG